MSYAHSFNSHRRIWGIEVLVCALHYIQNDQNTFPSTSASHSLAPDPFLSRHPPSAISIPTQRWQLCPALQWCTLYTSVLVEGTERIIILFLKVKSPFTRLVWFGALLRWPACKLMLLHQPAAPTPSTFNPHTFLKEISSYQHWW